MSRLALSLYRKRLHKILGAALDEEFLELIWAAGALQSDREQAAQKILGYSYPADAVSTEMTNKYAIYPWELETLANEMLTVPKQSFRDEYLTTTTNCRQFRSMAYIVHLLRNLENYEYGIYGEAEDILREMYRIAGRQFDWQRGYFNLPIFYRSAFIYGQDRCANYMMEKHGTSLAEMSLVGFALRTTAAEFPAFTPDLNVKEIGLDTDSLARVLALISLPIEVLREIAANERGSWQITAYRPSVFRTYPCVSFNKGKRFLCPLPELIFERVTSGVFYDVVGGGGGVRHEYGRRFEEYALRYIAAQLPSLGAISEWRYRANGRDFDSPDIVVKEDGNIRLAIECKATRMSFAARFADNADSERGYDDIVKGIFQLWRFFSHCRRGLSPLALSPDAVGMLLTLDSWLVMGRPVTEEMLRRAHAMADAKDKDITSEDRKYIVFCPITDLESVAAEANETSFLQALRLAREPQFNGWMLSSIHDKTGHQQKRKDYPFDNLGTLVPWWGKLDEERQRRRTA
jgi:hypothetical protein